jgi:hypothetical protein
MQTTTKESEINHFKTTAATTTEKEAIERLSSNFTDH